MKVGRNDPCPCGSGKKYKHCCYEKDSVKHEGLILEAEPAADAADADGETDADANEEQTHHHEKDRSRFTGQIRKKGGPVTRPATRGGQRGS